MIRALVGYTGFVGSNINEQEQFDYVFNSKNINEAFGLNPDLLIYSGVPAEKFYANQNPEKDFDIIQNAIESIKKINPKKLVLISTVDVYPVPIEVNEDSNIVETALQPYGKNRLLLEKWVEQNIESFTIIRLPGLFGSNLKKNFIYDVINVIPSVLNENKYLELSENNNWIKEYYTLQDNGFYKLNPISENENKDLKQKFLETGFSAINFTDSRGFFQFYNLKNIWKDIQIALENNIKKLNLATEPVSVNEIYINLFQKEFVNHVAAQPPFYNFETKHAESFSSKNNYLYHKDEVLNDIKTFILESK